MKLVQFSGCRVEVGAGGGYSATADDDADVSVGEGELLVIYWDDLGAVVLVGVEEQPGRFALVARSRPRRATLERDGAHCFVGSWSEGDASGSLRVELPEGTPPPPAGATH